MRTVALYEMLFGIITIVGGVVGYVSAGSWISLVTGLAAGIILLGAALKMQKGAKSGLYAELVVTLLLLGWFGSRIVTGQGGFMPAGLMSILSIVSLLLLVILLLQPAERKRIF